MPTWPAMEAQPQIAVPTPNLRGMADLLLLVTDGARQWPIVPTQLAAVAVPNLGVCVRQTCGLFALEEHAAAS